MLVLLGALALGACGVKGPLEPPPGAPQAEAPPTVGGKPVTTGSTPGVSDIPTTTARSGQWDKPARKRAGSDPLQGIARPDQPFILDGLL